MCLKFDDKNIFRYPMCLKNRGRMKFWREQDCDYGQSCQNRTIPADITLFVVPVGDPVHKHPLNVPGKIPVDIGGTNEYHIFWLEIKNKPLNYNYKK